MQARLTTKSTHEVIAAIQALDLESVKSRVMDAELGEGWSREYADSIATAYKTYLTMLVKYPEDAEDILLSKDVDEFWHTHILQTRKYREDCQKTFGNFLDHEPHVGRVTAEDHEKRTAQAQRTQSLYEREFGNAQTAEAAWSGYAISARQAAFSAAAIQAGKAAFSAAGVKAQQAAFSAASIEPAGAAFSAASVRAENAAFSAASIRAESAAFSAAAIRPEAAAFSAAGIRAGNGAFSAASIRPANAAFSAASVKG
jgi:hypothetical protein